MKYIIEIKSNDTETPEQTEPRSMILLGKDGHKAIFSYQSLVLYLRQTLRRMSNATYKV